MGKKTKQPREHQREDRMVTEQQRTAELLEALSTAVAKLQLSSAHRLLEEIRALLDDVLVAQRRTNHLLELALRAGFEDDEQLRNARQIK